MPGAVARVLPEVAAVDRAFDYLVGDGAPPASVGDRVRVNLHGRSVRGWVVELADDTEHDELKPLGRRLGIGPPASVVELAHWASWRWAGPWSRLLASASPSRVVATLPALPAPRALPEVHNQLRVFGQRLLRRASPTLVEVGPCTDPLDLVLAVLHGVETSESRGSVLVTTPTTGWAERLAERLRHRGLVVAGPDQWAQAAAGYPVVVGARAASLAPCPELAATVVLDAHDDAYRQTQAPCWDAVTMLAERSKRSATPLVLTSWCADPTLRALAATTEALEHEARMWPRVVVADLSVADPRERQLSSTFVDAAHRALAEDSPGVRVAVVLQRLGGVRLLACKSCGALAVCEPHGAAIAEGTGSFCCAQGCTNVARMCTTCGSTKLAVLREGITTLAARVSALLGVEVAEVSAATKSLPEAARVVVGTEAVLTRVRHAGVVCFAELDDYLCAPRAHSSLEALRAIGLAGRLVGARGSAVPGVVVVQTRLAMHPAVHAAVSGQPAGLLRAEAEHAASLGLPPHVALCALSGPGAHELAEALGAHDVAVTRDVDRYLVTARDHVVLCDALAAVPRPAAAVRVEVDPPGG